MSTFPFASGRSTPAKRPRDGRFARRAEDWRWRVAHLHDPAERAVDGGRGGSEDSNRRCGLRGGIGSLGDGAVGNRGIIDRLDPRTPADDAHLRGSRADHPPADAARGAGKDLRLRRIGGVAAAPHRALRGRRDGERVVESTGVFMFGRFSAWEETINVQWIDKAIDPVAPVSPVTRSPDRARLLFSPADDAYYFAPASLTASVPGG